MNPRGCGAPSGANCRDLGHNEDLRLDCDASIIKILLHLKDGGSNFFRNVSIYLQPYTTSHRRTTYQCHQNIKVFCCHFLNVRYEVH